MYVFCGKLLGVWTASKGKIMKHLVQIIITRLLQYITLSVSSPASSWVSVQCTSIYSPKTTAIYIYHKLNCYNNNNNTTWPSYMTFFYSQLLSVWTKSGKYSDIWYKGDNKSTQHRLITSLLLPAPLCLYSK